MKLFDNLFKTPAVIFFPALLLFLIFACDTLQNDQGRVEDVYMLDMKDGLRRSLIYEPGGNGEPQVVATLFQFPDTADWGFRLLSRADFSGEFNFSTVETFARASQLDLALQVASAFTPDWKVIEGFALQEGKSVGQDQFLGQNTGLAYQGLLLLKNNHLAFFLLDSIPNKKAFTAQAIDSSWSMFQQVLAIHNGKQTDDLDLPGSYKRRFIVELDSAGLTSYGIISFVKATPYRQAVQILKELAEKDKVVKNALYLDMGSVSEGRFYDRADKSYLMGNAGADIDRYTNLLILCRPLPTKTNP